MLRLLVVFMLLLPEIASANYPVTYRYVGNFIYDSVGQSICIHQEAIVDTDGFEFRHTPEQPRTFVDDFLELGE